MTTIVLDEVRVYIELSDWIERLALKAKCWSHNQHQKSEWSDRCRRGRIIFSFGASFSMVSYFLMLNKIRSTIPKHWQSQRLQNGSKLHCILVALGMIAMVCFRSCSSWQKMRMKQWPQRYLCTFQYGQQLEHCVWVSQHRYGNDNHSKRMALN